MHDSESKPIPEVEVRANVYSALAADDFDGALRLAEGIGGPESARLKALVYVEEGTPRNALLHLEAAKLEYKRAAEFDGPHQAGAYLELVNMMIIKSTVMRLVPSPDMYDQAVQEIRVAGKVYDQKFAPALDPRGHGPKVFTSYLAGELAEFARQRGHLREMRLRHHLSLEAPDPRPD